MAAVRHLSWKFKDVSHDVRRVTLLLKGILALASFLKVGLQGGVIFPQHLRRVFSPLVRLGRAPVGETAEDYHTHTGCTEVVSEVDCRLHHIFSASVDLLPAV